MSFFYTDPKSIDEAWWGRQPDFKDPYQTEIEFFWPLTEQIPLELDYTDCAKPISYTLNENTISNYPSYTLSSSWGTTTIGAPPTLTITPTDSKGYIQIGGLNIGQEEEPNLLRKALYKLLGFKWKKN